MVTKILGDWGTTRLRLFRLEADVVVDKLHGPGIGQLTVSPAETLLAAIAPWRALAEEYGVLLCGMAGSRNGLAEVAYAPCPAGVGAWYAASEALVIERVRATITPGLFARNFADLPDVMRGEETQIFGAMALDPALARGRHILLLPGTHSKWAELIEGCVMRFHSFPTGEMFALLRDHSTLTRAGTCLEKREAGFADGLARAGTGLLASLFEARAAQLVEGRTLGWALGLISGLLVGGEVSDASRLLGGGFQRVTVIGDAALTYIYRQALQAAGIVSDALDGDVCAIAGLGSLSTTWRGGPA